VTDHERALVACYETLAAELRAGCEAERVEPADVFAPDDPRAVAVAARLRPESFKAALPDPFALAFDPADFDLNPGPFDWRP
jgi:hypothetical protein